MLYFWAAQKSCVDVLKVSIVEVTTTTTPTTTTKSTVTTVTATTTVSSTTNTLAAAVANLPSLNDIEKLIEQQIEVLQGKSDKLSARVDVLTKDNAALKGTVQGLSAENKKLNEYVADLQSQLAAPPPTPAPVTVKPSPFSFMCVDDGATECAPSVVADGNNAAVQACCGTLEFQSAECSVNPCQLKADVEELKRRL